MRNFLYALAALAALVATPLPAQDDFAVPPAPHKEDYFIPGLAPVRADRGADLTIVYFMDYQCPACRSHTPDVSAVFGSDRRLRVIYRDTPIFGPQSVEAAKFAIASQFQGKHEAFHKALMAQKMPLDAAAVKEAAAKAGVNWARLEKDRAAHRKAIDAQIAQNQNLSEAAGISGTPAFIIGDTLADGALDAKGLRAEIADARAKGAKAPVSTETPPAVKPEPAETSTADSAEIAANTVSAAPALANAIGPGPDAPAPVFRPAEPAPSPSTSESHTTRMAILAVLALLVVGAAVLLVRRRRPPGNAA